MAINDKNIIKLPISSNTSNFKILNSSEIKDGIIKDSDFKSIGPNSLFYKLSSSLLFLQKNGIIQYIQGNEYKINSLVSVFYYDDKGNIVNTILKCINTDNGDFCSILPNDDFTILNGNIIFNNKRWNSIYWSEVSKDKVMTYKTKVQETTYNYDVYPNSRDSSQVKNIELFDLSNLQSTSFTEINFNLNVNRYTQISANCSLFISKNDLIFRVNSVNDIRGCYTQNNFLWYENSIFKYMALEGMFFTVNEVTKKLYLTIVGATNVNKPEFDLEVSINYGFYNVEFKEEVIASFIDNDDYIVVPICHRSSNKYDNECMRLTDMAYSLSYVESFANGLYRVTTEQEMDKWLYPVFRINKVTDAKVFDMNDKYKFYSSKNDRYISADFPELIGSYNSGLTADRSDYYSGVFEYTSTDISRSSPNPYAQGQNALIWNNTGAPLSYSSRQYFDTSKKTAEGDAMKQVYFVSKYYDDRATLNGFESKVEDLTPEDLFNSDESNPDMLITASITTFSYIKLW